MRQPRLQTQRSPRFFHAHRALLFITASQLCLSRRPMAGSLAPSLSSSILLVAPMETATSSHLMGRELASCGTLALATYARSVRQRKGRWGVYQVWFPRPVYTVDDLVSNFRSVLPQLQKIHAKVFSHGTPEV